MILSQIDMKTHQSSKTHLIHMTPLPSLHSSVHGFPFYQDPASVLLSLPMQTNRSFILKISEYTY